MKENGDVFVELTNVENRDKLTLFLQNESFSEHEIVELNSKQPIIPISGMKDFSTKEEFMEKIKNKNPKIQQWIDKGLTFSIVYSKDPNGYNNVDGRKYYQAVAHVATI